MDIRQATDPELDALLRAFSEELIQYTPEHFRDIRCTVRAGLEEGRKAMFYHIECPQFPDESTGSPSPEMHQIAFAIHDHWERNGETFPGFQLRCVMGEDGAWRSTLDLLT